MRNNRRAQSMSKTEHGADKPKMSGPTETYTWIWVDASYLREQAQRCVRLARDCPHKPTSHELESLGVDLMQKAAELDELQQGDKGSLRSNN
jgi:hypothetical protein